MHVDNEVREKAQNELVRRGNSSIQILINTLKNKNNDELMRARAATALGMLKAEEAVFVLIDSLDEGVGPLQLECINALGLIGNEKAIGPLMNLLASNDKTWHQHSIARALFEITGHRYKYIKRDGTIKYYYPTADAIEIRKEIIKRRLEHLKESPLPGLGEDYKSTYDDLDPDTQKKLTELEALEKK